MSCAVASAGVPTLAAYERGGARRECVCLSVGRPAWKPNSDTALPRPLPGRCHRLLADEAQDLRTDGVIDPALATRLAAAVRLGNVLVHAYLELDHGRLYDELGWIEDAAEFAAAIEGWLSRQGEPHT